MNKTIFLNLKNNSISNILCFLSYLDDFIKTHSIKHIYILTDHNFLFENGLSFEFIEEINFTYDQEIKLEYDRKIFAHVLYSLNWVSKKLLNLPSETQPKLPPMKKYEVYRNDSRVVICSYDQDPLINSNNKDAWQISLNLLKDAGYDIFDVSENFYNLNHTVNISDKDLIFKIKHIISSKTFVTLNNDYAWIAKSYGVPTVLISPHTKEYNDFESFRVQSKYGCSGCYNTFMSESKCPLFLNTQRERECYKLITEDNLVEQINKSLLRFDNYKNEFEEICYGLIEKLPNTFPKVNKNSNKKSLLIETRKLLHNEFIIKNTIQKLGDGWGHIIYCHKNNVDQIKSICDEISPDIEIRLLDFELDRNNYNNLCLNVRFWNEINCEKVLVYQTDTFIFNDFDDKFLKYDWIGSVWSDEHTNAINSKLNWKNLWGCNGGLNIRSVSVIKKILNSKAIPKSLFGDTDKLTEDTYFSWYIKNKYKFPTKEVCDLFSNELKYNDEIFGCHQPWNGSFEEFKKKAEKTFTKKK